MYTTRVTEGGDSVSLGEPEQAGCGHVAENIREIWWCNGHVGAQWSIRGTWQQSCRLEQTRVEGIEPPDNRVVRWGYWQQHWIGSLKASIYFLCCILVYAGVYLIQTTCTKSWCWCHFMLDPAIATAAWCSGSPHWKHWRATSVLLAQAYFMSTDWLT